MIRICPNPDPWHRVYGDLMAAWRERGGEPPEPPVPLILNGWVFSSDADKEHRWAATVAWAGERGLAHLIPSIPDDEWHFVSTYSSPRWNDYSCTQHPKQVRPSDDDLTRYFTYLESHWLELAGPAIGPNTRPLAFTGRRRRRLLVLADARVVPPWGDWNSFRPSANRESFASLRRAVNAAISPHAVDSIDFRLSRDGV
jgi:hypothetical protein